MKKQFKLGVIGSNLIAQTIIKGAVLSDFLSERKIIASGISDKYADAFEELGVKTVNDDKFVFENSEFQLIAVSAEQLIKVAKNIGSVNQVKIISVSDRLKKNEIKSILGISSIKVARGVANLPCIIGSGAVGVDMSDFNSSLDDVEFISNIFDCIGTVLSVDESKFDAITGLSVNGPAYVFMFIDSLIDAGVKQGLKRSEAKLLAVQTVLGSAELVEREEYSLSELTMKTCNNGGTALEAVKSLEKNKFREIIDEAVDNSIKRLKELD